MRDLFSIVNSRKKCKIYEVDFIDRLLAKDKKAV